MPERVIDSTIHKCDSPDGPVTVREDTTERWSPRKGALVLQSTYPVYVLVSPDGSETRLDRKDDDFFARHGGHFVCTITADSENSDVNE